MIYRFFQLCLLISISFCLAYGQRMSDKEAESFRIALEEDEKLALKCELQIRNEQIKEFGKPRPKVSHLCTNGCPVKIPKPAYPAIARQRKKSASVTVSLWVDTTGKVVRATVVNGPKAFRLAAVEAAYGSSFTPTVICNGNKVRFRKTIRFDFRTQSD